MKKELKYKKSFLKNRRKKFYNHDKGLERSVRKKPDQLLKRVLSTVPGFSQEPEACLTSEVCKKLKANMAGCAQFSPPPPFVSREREKT